MVCCRHPVIHHDTENAATFDALDSMARWYRGCTGLPRSPLEQNTSSLIFVQFNLRLFAAAQSYTCTSSELHVISLAAGTMRYVSSAYFRILLPLCTASAHSNDELPYVHWRPVPVTTHPIYILIFTASPGLPPRNSEF